MTNFQVEKKVPYSFIVQDADVSKTKHAFAYSFYSQKPLGFASANKVATLEKSAGKHTLHALPKQLGRPHLWNLQFTSMNFDDSSICVITSVITQWITAYIWF